LRVSLQQLPDLSVRCNRMLAARIVDRDSLQGNLKLLGQGVHGE
jgi:hypothetical protein